MPSIAYVPVEVFLDNLFHLLPVSDLIALSLTCKYFSRICEDDAYWKERCAADFDLSGNETAQQHGWKALYRELSYPKLFVWGCRSEGRLGPNSYRPFRGSGVPFPTEIEIPGIRLVSLAASGWSFHALDSKGSVYVWGTLNGESTSHGQGFNSPFKCAPTPHRLILPETVRRISCGRHHMMALDDKTQVWTFLSWGRPFRLQSALLDCRSPLTTPVQIECGWMFSTVLTGSGDVLLYWPHRGNLQHFIDANDRASNKQGDGNEARASEDGTIPCVMSVIQADPYRLPAIPALPNLPDAGLTEEQLDRETKLIKIAAYDNNLVGLTNKGHVLKFGGLGSRKEYLRSRWEYLPNFSEAARVCSHPTFAGQNAVCEPPKTMRITHLSAHFRTFVAYSRGPSSVVLMGGQSTNVRSRPQILPALQYRSIVSVTLGDYHFGAVTSTGRLLTWGAYSKGALGLGDPLELPLGAPGGYQTAEEVEDARTNWWIEPPRVNEPVEVKFDRGRKRGRRRCVAASASGWHTGALVNGFEVRSALLSSAPRGFFLLVLVNPAAALAFI